MTITRVRTLILLAAFVFGAFGEALVNYLQPAQELERKF